MRNVGENNPMYGRKHSEETKKKISESRAKYKREKHPLWKGGRRKTSSGYIELLLPDHHRARGNNYVFEHIVVAEKSIGRKIFASEHVHHINGVKTDNRPENLQVLTHGEHTKLHSKERRKGYYLECVVCSSEFYVKPSRKDRAKCCSRKCVGHYTKLKRDGELK